MIESSHYPLDEIKLVLFFLSENVLGGTRGAAVAAGVESVRDGSTQHQIHGKSNV